jgi:hypothetical protein
MQSRVVSHPTQSQQQVDVNGAVIIHFADDAFAQTQGLDFEPVDFGAFRGVFEQDNAGLWRYGKGMSADTLTLPPTLTAAQLDDARDAHASAAIEGTNLSEAEAMEIAAEFYASGIPERVAALPTHPEMSYEELPAEFAARVCCRG